MQPTLDDARKRWILALACLAQFMVILDVSVVNVALPSIRDDLHFSAVKCRSSQIEGKIGRAHV